MAWTGLHYVFAVEMFFKTGESVIGTLRAFQDNLMLRLNDAASDGKLVLLQVENSI